MDFHSIGKYTEEDLKRSQKEPRDEFGVKVLNIFYDMDSGMIFCLLDVVLPDIGDIIAYRHGLHSCEEVYPYRNRKKVQSIT